ncbi:MULTISPECIES: acyl-CoA dehydrogenase [unclassified Nocardioides]|uniref:acyl-CoA dehydrogenase n=1 Tax=unclassified Nocardioides TaxID=2615069 RepID=UPI0009F04D66|nr:MULTISPECIES: acyl-CoA dehydrogenase [unclassified Nocardioides]GAW48192.1 acyl-CoA dehydrogenase domain-containing protein [Nocardioides sp. PD653-B2]GAW53448.1 acyl-CoA dehydrogenase domain-containing protein [Nocardioides sp. PD653]
MSIGISDEHVELASSLRRWAADLRGRELARAAEDDADAGFEDVWAAAAQMGVATIGLPEVAGGGGGSVLDVAVALEACAHELVPGPLLGVAVASSLLGEIEGVSSVLGEGAVVALALSDVVWDTPTATHVLLADGDDSWRVLPRDAVELTSALGLDLSRRFGTGRVVDASAGVPVPGLTAGLVRRTAVTLGAAEAAGVARWCLATAVEYAKVREQFGQKIGSFQAVKHLCAEMLETAESVTAAAWDVASVAGGDDEQWAFSADVAAAVAFDGAVEVAKSCIQVLGGIGFTFEHDAHLYLRRALSLRGLLGGADAAAERLTAGAVAGVRRRVQLDLEGRDAAIRDEIRAGVEKVAALAPADRRAALVETGYLTPHWPAPYGLGADAVTQIVIDQELARAEVTRPDIVIAGWAVPTILEHGTDEQREKFVRPSLLGDLVWCQLFSEPGAGSDLASLRTRAEKVDGGWLLTGQKVWNSVAERADWGICLARTNPDARKHQGISYFLVDMRNTPGIDVRPLREITGKALFNEVFLDDVFVPDDMVVGEVDDGWRLARTTLANERVAMATSRLSKSTERAIELVGADATPAQRVAVGHSIALATVCSLLGVRSTLRSLAGQGPGAESSVAKLLGVRNRQDGAELVVELHGDRVLLGGSDDLRADVWEMLNTRCLSIAGGTTQILRNVAGERILGLPR